MNSELTVFIDGACRGNPGPASAGVVIRNGDAPARGYGFYLGRGTNNIAEYTALVRAAALIVKLVRDKKTVVKIYSDSELMVRQMRGEYRVKNPELQKLRAEAAMTLLKLPRWSIHHVPREQNREADRMANRALDEEGDVRE